MIFWSIYKMRNIWNLIIWWGSSSSHQNKKNDFFISLSTISPTFSSSSSHVNWMDISSHLNLPPSQLSFSPSERSTPLSSHLLLSSPPLFLSNHGFIVNVRWDEMVDYEMNLRLPSLMSLILSSVLSSLLHLILQPQN